MLIMSAISERNIQVPRDKIAAFCERNHILKLSLFGSVLREDFHSRSDVDVLVEFEPGHYPSFPDKAAMRRQLSRILHRRADLRTPNELSPYFRQAVLDAAEVQYVR